MSSKSTYPKPAHTSADADSRRIERTRTRDRRAAGRAEVRRIDAQAALREYRELTSN